MSVKWNGIFFYQNNHRGLGDQIFRLECGILWIRTAVGSNQRQ